VAQGMGCGEVPVGKYITSAKILTMRTCTVKIPYCNNTGKH
jgi:hypothetical protein